MSSGNLPASTEGNILSKGPDIDSNNSGWTPLIYACRYGNTDEVAKLISSGEEVTARDNMGWNAVPFAVASGNIATLKEILKAKKWGREDLAPALCLSALNGDCDMAELLLGNRADPNTPVKDSGITPLMLAAGEGHVKMVALLLEKGADPDMTNALHQTSLDAAVCRGQEIIQDILAPVTHLRSKISFHIPLPISPPNRALLSPMPQQSHTLGSPFPPSINVCPIVGHVASPCGTHRSHLNFCDAELCPSPARSYQRLHIQNSPACGPRSPCHYSPHRDFVALCSSLPGKRDCLSPFYTDGFGRSPWRQRTDDFYKNHSPCRRRENMYYCGGFGGQIDQDELVRHHQKVVLKGNKRIRRWWLQMKKRCRGSRTDGEDVNIVPKNEFTLNTKMEKRLVNFLRTIKMTEYHSLFTLHEINFETFLTMTESDLKEIGIQNPSHRSRILAKISKFSKCASYN